MEFIANNISWIKAYDFLHIQLTKYAITDFFPNGLRSLGFSATHILTRLFCWGINYGSFWLIFCYWTNVCHHFFTWNIYEISNEEKCQFKTFTSFLYIYINLSSYVLSSMVVIYLYWVGQIDSQDISLSTNYIFSITFNLDKMKF